MLYSTSLLPDISYAAQTLSQFSQSPRNPHLKALIKVLRYLKACPGQGLLFPSNTNLHLRPIVTVIGLIVVSQEDLFQDIASS